jgi:hypothetical protein
MVRTWTVTDTCGNSASVPQTINFMDNAPPTFVGCPESETVSCDETITMPAAPTAADDCGSEPPAVVFDCCVGNNVITRHWHATDTCGKVNDCTQKVTIECIQAQPGVVTDSSPP